MRVPAVHVAAVGDHAARHRPHLSPRAGEKRTGEEDQSLPELLEVALGGWKSKNLISSPMLVMLFNVYFPLRNNRNLCLSRRSCFNPALGRVRQLGRGRGADDEDEVRLRHLGLRLRTLLGRPQVRHGPAQTR